MSEFPAAVGEDGMPQISAAMEAAKKGRAEQLARLAQYEQGVETNFINHQGKDFVFKYDAAAYSKQRKPIKVKVDRPTLLLVAALEGDSDLVEKLIDEGVDPNHKNAEGLTALHTAAIENSIKVASALIRKGASVDTRDNDQWTPLHAASFCGNWRVAQLLIQSGADLRAVNADGNLPIDLAEADRIKDILQSEMDAHGLTEEQLDELRKQHHLQFTKAVETAIATKDDLNAKDDEGATMLHVATSNGYIELVNKLLQNGADPNIADPEGHTPLHLAVFFEEYKIVEALCAKGALLTAKNRFGETPPILTEDPAMLRLIKAIEQKERTSSLPMPAHSAKMDNSMKVRSLKHGKLAKLDVKSESANKNVVYAELEFGDKKDKREKKDSKSLPQAGPPAGNKTIYAELVLPDNKKRPDASDVAAAEAEAAAELAAMSGGAKAMNGQGEGGDSDNDDDKPKEKPVYATPQKKPAANGSATSIPAPPQEAAPRRESKQLSVPPDNRVEARKPSLNVVTAEEMANSTNAAEEPAGKKDKAASGGGCCLLM